MPDRKDDAKENAKEVEGFTIKKASFVTSVAKPGSGYPNEIGAEIAMVGRSNVGKSSLINALCGNKKLARISSTPGKTRQINFFLINDSFHLVDLPGYGFARAPKHEQAQWGELMESYLELSRLSHIFLLLDIRHAPTAEDKQMYNWILHYAIPFTIIATKADKIARSKQKNAACAAAKALGAPPFAIPFSSENLQGKRDILDRIGAIVGDNAARSQSAPESLELE